MESLSSEIKQNDIFTGAGPVWRKLFPIWGK